MIGIEGARQMWRRVIMQALRDALCTAPSRDRGSRSHRAEAQAWFEGRSSDFDHVCTLAGLDADVIREWWQSVRDDQQKLDDYKRFMREAAVRKQKQEENDNGT